MRLGRPQFERLRVMAEAPEQVDAQRVKRQIERDLEISREMRAGDLVAVRLQIVDQQLAEAAFLAQRLLGGGGGAGLWFDFIVVAGRDERLIAVVVDLGIIDVIGFATWRRCRVRSAPDAVRIRRHGRS